MLSLEARTIHYHTFRKNNLDAGVGRITLGPIVEPLDIETVGLSSQKESWLESNFIDFFGSQQYQSVASRGTVTASCRGRTEVPAGVKETLTAIVEVACARSHCYP